MTRSDIVEIRAKITGVLGKKAWGVAPGQGSFITLEFGQPVSPEQPGEKVHGEWHLWVYGCAWRLEDADTVLVASQDDQSKIAVAIQRLEGLVLQSFELFTPALDATLTFENNVVLRLFSCDTEEIESWMLYTPDQVVTVGPGSTWSYGQ